jgi:amino acid permease
MFKGNRTLVRATLTMIGTIIGAGIFGVPAMFEKTGVLVGTVTFWFIAAIVLATAAVPAWCAVTGTWW